MTNSIEIKSDYDNLVKDLKNMIEKGRLEVVCAVSEIFVKTNWQLGKRLSQTDLIAQQETEAGFLSRLSDDLGISPTTLYRALLFYRTYPKGIPQTPEFQKLGWSAHVELMSVKDPEQRLFYTRKLLEENWSRDALRRAIRNDLFTKTKDKKAAPQDSRLDRPGTGLHTYQAIVERVIDGDTLEARIDLGFDVWRVERIRLRGIDTPELRTPAGKAAKSFVVEELSQVPFIVLRTYKTDKYARYVADVFYSATLKKKDRIFAKGGFLNQQLLDNNHARRMEY
ncbi:MAG: thermonuclease family protein [Deltaproteobacteria bacterium]|nr:thermonuclease family protein [Deltaproteobacteria bacterium]